MIYSLNGILIDRDLSSVVIECGGVGYKCSVTNQTLRQLPETGSKLFLYTYMNVREDAVDLFGFITKDEMETFRLLISVNGVGPKAAIAILSEMQPDKLSFCIAAGDAKAITKAQGVGPKLAQRIVLELKDKVAAPAGEPVAGGNAVADNVSGDNMGQAIAALVALGYSQSEAVSAAAKADPSAPVEMIIKTALKYLF